MTVHPGTGADLLPRGWAVAVGVGLAAVTVAAVTLLDDPTAFVALAVLLGMIGGAYLGFAAADGRLRASAWTASAWR